MRLDSEFLDALESWVIIGKCAGQEPSTHKFEVIFLSFISLESGRRRIESGAYNPITPRCVRHTYIAWSHGTIVDLLEQQRFCIGSSAQSLRWSLVGHFAHTN